MQDLLCGQDLYAIKVDDLTQNIFFLIEVQVTKKCVRDFLRVLRSGGISCCDMFYGCHHVIDFNHVKNNISNLLHQ